MSQLDSARDPFVDSPFVGALRSAGADSPQHARLRATLPHISEDFLAVLMTTDIVRAAGRGRYYLVQHTARRTQSARFTPIGVSLMIAVWIGVLLVPMIQLLFNR